MGTRADRSPSRYPQHRHSPPQRKRHFSPPTMAVQFTPAGQIHGDITVPGVIEIKKTRVVPSHDHNVSFTRCCRHGHEGGTVGRG